MSALQMPEFKCHCKLFINVNKTYKPCNQIFVYKYIKYFWYEKEQPVRMCVALVFKG